MGYRNGRDVLPPDLLALVQQYAEGELIAIPRREKKTRTASPSAQETLRRNDEIRLRHAGGMSVSRLAGEYYLSPQAIYKILSGCKK